jgi:uncharacterized membrane protein
MPETLFAKVDLSRALVLLLGCAGGIMPSGLVESGNLCHLGDDRVSSVQAGGLFFSSLVRAAAICKTRVSTNQTTSMDGKTKAIISHVTFIGLIVAFVLNSSEKDEYASFYIRQQLGLTLSMIVLAVSFTVLGIICGVVPIIGMIVDILLLLVFLVVWLGAFVFWILSLIYSIQGEQKALPVVGSYFQEWFKSI